LRVSLLLCFFVRVIDKVSLLLEHLRLLAADFLLTALLYNPTQHYESATQCPNT
jgi:hypothetical protein